MKKKLSQLNDIFKLIEEINQRMIEVDDDTLKNFGLLK